MLQNPASPKHKLFTDSLILGPEPHVLHSQHVFQGCCHPPAQCRATPVCTPLTWNEDAACDCELSSDQIRSHCLPGMLWPSHVAQMSQTLDKPVQMQRLSDKPVQRQRRSDKPVQVQRRSDKSVQVQRQSDKPVQMQRLCVVCKPAATLPAHTTHVSPWSKSGSAIDDD